MRVISRVVFRADQDTHDYDGHSQNWHGEDSYRLGETYTGLPIVSIEVLERFGSTLWAEIYVKENKLKTLVCSIPIHAVTRLYWEDL